MDGKIKNAQKAHDTALRFVRRFGLSRPEAHRINQRSDQFAKVTRSYLWLWEAFDREKVLGFDDRQHPVFEVQIHVSGGVMRLRAEAGAGACGHVPSPNRGGLDGSRTIVSFMAD